MKIDVREKAMKIENRLFTMFPQKHKPNEEIEKPISMYSYERAATQFWTGFIARLIEDGMPEDVIEALLVSKQMKWMLDGCYLESFGYKQAGPFYVFESLDDVKNL